VITAIIEASVSFGRLYTFLLNEELDPEAVTYEPVTPFMERGARQRICIKDGAFSWNLANENILKGINMEVCDKQLVAIVGRYFSAV
jgi:hypothetical protein